MSSSPLSLGLERRRRWVQCWLWITATTGVEIFAEAAGARVVRVPSNPGFGAGHNQGAALGSAPYVLLLNPDATFRPDALAVGLTFYSTRTRQWRPFRE